VFFNSRVRRGSKRRRKQFVVANVLEKRGGGLYVTLVDRHSHQEALGLHRITDVDTTTEWGVQQAGTERIDSLAVSMW
jgi:hypothetical protein